MSGKYNQGVYTPCKVDTLGRYLEIIELDNGDLMLRSTDEGLQEIEDRIDDTNEEVLMYDLCEDLIANGCITLYGSDDIALHGSMIIMPEAWFSLDDSDVTTLERKSWQRCRYWFYNLYAIRSYFQDMRNQGFVVWQQGKNYE